MLTSWLRCSHPPQQAGGFLCPPASVTETAAGRSPERSWRRPKRMTTRRRETGKQSNLLAARSPSWFPVWPVHLGCHWWVHVGPVSSAPAAPAPQSSPAWEQTPPWCGSLWQGQWEMMLLAVGGLQGVDLVPGPAWLSDRRSLGVVGAEADRGEGFEIQIQTQFGAAHHHCRTQHSPQRSYYNYSCCCSLNE